MKKYIIHKPGRALKGKTEIAVIIALDTMTAHDSFHAPNLYRLKEGLQNRIDEMPRLSIASPNGMFSLILEPEMNPKVLRIYRKTKRDNDVWCSISIQEELINN